MSTLKRRRAFASATTSLCLCVLISGCTLMNPHVRWERPERDASVPADQPMSLREAEKYADNAREAYRGAVGDQALLVNLLPLPLIALAGIGIGYGIAQTTNAANVVLGTSLAGASGLAAGYWYSSPPRQRAYIAGIKAIDCAVIAVETLYVDRDFVSGGLDDLSTATGELNANMGRVTQASAALLAVAGADTALIIEGREAIKIALATIEPADDAYGAGVKLHLASIRAGPALKNAVDRIATLVDEAVLATQPDLAQLPGIINGLAAGAAQFVQLPEPGTFPGFDAAPSGATGATSQDIELDSTEEELAEDPMFQRLRELESQLRSAIDDLNLSIAQVESATRRVAGLVGAVNQETSFEALKNCGVTIEGPATALKTQPSGTIQFMEGTAGNRGFTISGGEHPYAAQFLDQVDGLTVQQPVAFGPTVIVHATDQVSPNTYNLQISDVKSNSLIIPVTVQPKGGAVTPPVPPNGNGVDAAVEEMQQALATVGLYQDTVDGIRGENTNDALKAYLAAVQINQVAADMDATEFLALFVDNSTGIDISTDVETSEQRLERIRASAIENLLLKKFGQKPGPTDGLFDEETEAAITAVNGGTAFTVDDGVDRNEALLKMLRDKEAPPPTEEEETETEDPPE